MDSQTLQSTRQHPHMVRGLVLAVLTAVILTGVAIPASATTPSGTVAVSTQRMSDATLHSTQAGWYNKGSRLSLACYKRGQSVQGYYSRWIPGGWDNLWYKTSDGYFVADVDINTGSNNPVTPACGVTPPPPPPANGRKWGQTRATNAGAAGNCTWGAYEKFRAATGKYPALAGDAKNWANSARATGWTVVADAQARAIVVFQPGVQGAKPPSGHVAWVDSVSRRADGLYVSITEMNGKDGLGRWSTRTIKDVAGMSYILAP